MAALEENALYLQALDVLGEEILAFAQDIQDSFVVMALDNGAGVVADTTITMDDVAAYIKANLHGGGTGIAYLAGVYGEHQFLDALADALNSWFLAVNKQPFLDVLRGYGLVLKEQE